MTGVHLSGLYKSFGPVKVLKDVALQAEPGEFVALVGPSGCGKSTLLRCIAGLEAIDQGSIERQGEIVRFWEKLVYIQPKVVDEASGKWVKEKKVHRLMHCAERTQGVISGATYTENGRFISSVSFDAPQSAMSAIPPGTLAAAELELVCKISAKP